MEIICRYCQGTIDVEYKNIYKLADNYFVTYCPGCDTENEVWDVYDWFDVKEIAWIEKWNNDENENGYSEGRCLLDDDEDDY